MKIHNRKKLEEFGKNGKLNIALVSDAYYPLVGGAAVVVENLANYLKDIANVVVIASNCKYEDKVDFPVIRCKALQITKSIGSLAFPSLDKKFRKVISTLPIDIVHCHSVYSLANYFLKYAKQHNIPFVLTGHSKFPEEYASIVPLKFITNALANRVTKFANKCDEVWPVSDGCAEVYKKMGFKTKMKVSRNATEMSYPENPEELIKSASEEFGFEGKKNIISFLSRLETKTKNIDMLLNACQILKKDNFEFTLVIAGNGPDKKSLEVAAKHLGISDNVIFTGGIYDFEKKMGFYLASDLFVFPSVIDTCGLVVLEAAAMQTPSIMIANSCPAEMAIDNENAFLCELSAESIAEKIKEVLSNRELLNKVSLQAQKDLGKNWKVAAKETFDRYVELIKTKGERK